MHVAVEEKLRAISIFKWARILDVFPTSQSSAAIRGNSACAMEFLGMVSTYPVKWLSFMGYPYCRYVSFLKSCMRCVLANTILTTFVNLIYPKIEAISWFLLVLADIRPFTE